VSDSFNSRNFRARSGRQLQAVKTACIQRQLRRTAVSFSFACADIASVSSGNKVFLHPAGPARADAQIQGNCSSAFFMNA